MSPPVVIAKLITKVYQQQPVVNAISFSISKGQCYGILGPNGAGKTTTLKMLMGHTPPTQGELTVLGYSIPQQARQMRAQIGIVPQQDNLDPDLTVFENLFVYGRYFGLKPQILTQRIPAILAFAALEKKTQALIPTLSGGMQRRLSLGRALINEPQLLILDEPTTGLDPQARQLIWQRLRQLKHQQLTLILTTHYMEEAERLCDSLIIMDQGQILEMGSPQSLIERYIEPQVIEVYGPDVDSWHEQIGQHWASRYEHVGDTYFYYSHHVDSLLHYLQQQSQLRYLHRRAALEDVFLTLTGRDLRDD